MKEYNRAVSKKLSIFYAISGTAGIFSSIWLLQMASEQKNVLFWGLSAVKLALLFAMLFLTMLCFFLSKMLRKGELSETLVTKFSGYAALLAIYVLVLERVFCFPPVGNTAFFRSITGRLRPVAAWLKMYGFGYFLFILIFERKRIVLFFKRRRTACLFGGIVFALLFFILVSAQKFGWGLECISATFYRQGVSLLEGHLILPLLFLFPLLLIETSLLAHQTVGRSLLKVVSIFVPVLIWCGAVWTWRMTPFEGRSYFVPALRLPNLNFYPASDAENYDLLAQSILLGNGFRNGMTVVRPLYVAFLSLLHAVVGNDYMRITDLQIYVLALFPVVVYAIGKELRNPTGGFIAAVWVILREAYSIAITSQVQVSNSRLFMSDLPTALMISVLIWIGLRSFRKRKEEQTSAAFLLGGMLGVCMLIRTQCVILAPLLFLPFLRKPCRKSALQKFAFVVLGTAVVFLPWIVWNRVFPNESLTGETSEGNYLIKLYQTAAYGPDAAADLSRSLPLLILERPKEVASAVWNHFYNNEISSLLVLPEREVSVTQASQFFIDRDLFWYRESSRNVLEINRPRSFLYCLMISLGIFSAVSGVGPAGIFPLFVHLFYNAGNALAMNSGFRFILPVDWILPFYAALGCGFFLRAAVTLFTKVTFESWPIQLKSRHYTLSFLPVLGLLLGVGALLPCCDRLIPYRFADVFPDAVYEIWLRSDPEHRALAEAENWDSSIRDGKIRLMVGRAFYPRFYAAEEGDSGGSAAVKQEQPFSRMVWMFQDRSVHCVWKEMEAAEAAVPISDPQDVFIIAETGLDSLKVLEMEPLVELLVGQ